MSQTFYLLFSFCIGIALYVLGRKEQRAGSPGHTLTATLRANYASLVHSRFLFSDAVNGAFESIGRLAKDANGCGEFLSYQLTLGGVMIYNSRVDFEMVDDQGVSHLIEDDTFLAMEPRVIGLLRLPLIAQLDLALSFVSCMFTDDGIDCGWLMKKTLERYPGRLVKADRFHSFKPGWGKLLLVERVLRPGDRGMLSQAGTNCSVTTASREELPMADAGRHYFGLYLSYAGALMIVLTITAFFTL